ncbi:WGxxGxxG family protein [Paenibacillus sp. HJGM_3]|uniref:WGxxGxxG family protein n=1 Tax=Paenibacillus sp. HJGM_3 TaxID=3379816 RepID=UPI003858BD7C
MLHRLISVSVLSVALFAAPLGAYAAASNEPSVPVTNTSPIGTLNTDNMGATQMSHPGTPAPSPMVTPGVTPMVTPGVTPAPNYTGTGVLPGYDGRRGNGYYDMTGTGIKGPDGMTIHTNQYRARAAGTTNRNWGWLGLIGLVGLAGMFGRNRNEERDRA